MEKVNNKCGIDFYYTDDYVGAKIFILDSNLYLHFNF